MENLARLRFSALLLAFAWPLAAGTVTTADAFGDYEHSAQEPQDRGDLRPEYRGFAGRLSLLEHGIDQRERDGRYSAVQARAHRDHVAAIRAQFRYLSDHSTRKLRRSEHAALEADLETEERAAAMVVAFQP